MKAQFGQIKAGSAALKIMLADARSARNRTTREARSAAASDAASARRYRKARAGEDRARALAMNRRVRIQVANSARPRMRGRTPHKLFYRLGDRAVSGLITSGGGGRSAGTRAIHFAVTARGFASRSGRGWRNGEGERAVLYIVREDALEGGEAGWWSNIAEDRVELVAFHRTSEAVERHDRANANVYMSEVIALPVELTARQRRKSVRRYCRHFEKRGLAYTVAMHKPDPASNGRNYHCHIVYSLRPTRRLAPYDWSFAALKCADVNTPAGILARRKLVVDAINGTLKAAGSGQRYTHLSNRARGLGAPSIKQGQKLTWVLRRIVSSEARTDRLAQLQTMVARLRDGFAVMQRLEAAGIVVKTRLRTAHAMITTVTKDNVTSVGIIDDRAGVVKRKLRNRLQQMAVHLQTPDTLTRKMETAADHVAVADRRREALENALTRLSVLPADLAPVREIVQTRLEVQAAQLRNVLFASAERVVNTVSQPSQPAPSPPVERAERRTGRERIPTKEAVAMLRLVVPNRIPEKDMTANLMPGVSKFSNADDLAADRTKRRRLKAIAKAREAKAIADLRERAFARLEAVAAVITRDKDGRYRVAVDELLGDERRALHHPEYSADTQARLAQLHTPVPLPMAAERATPTSSPTSLPKASQIDNGAVDVSYLQMLAAQRGQKGR